MKNNYTYPQTSIIRLDAALMQGTSMTIVTTAGADPELGRAPKKNTPAF